MNVSVHFCNYDCPINLKYQIPARTDRESRPEYICARCNYHVPVSMDLYFDEFKECGRDHLVCPKCYPQWCVVRSSWVTPKPENPNGIVGQIIWE